MKKPIDRNFDSIRDYMIAMEAYVRYLEGESEEVEPVDIIYFKGALVEDDEASFEATINVEDDSQYGFSIRYTDKRTPKKVKYWDNDRFFNGLLESDEISLASLEENELSIRSHNMLIGFLKELKGLGWF
jgi:hypothetical protein